MAGAEADAGEVKQALERLLVWPDIARSPQLANFLAYIVDKRLGGDAQSIKAYSIAVDVFGRSPDFDPQADPIVRVQARRLRGLLDQYYRGPGADDPLRIELPIGRYVPDFIDSATEPSARPIGREPSVPGDVGATPTEAPKRKRGHVTLSWFVLLVLAIGATALTYALATWGARQAQQEVVTGAVQMPQVRIMEFQNLTGDSMLTPSIAALAVELVADFEPLIIVDVVFGGRGSGMLDDDKADDFVLTGIVRSAAEVDQEDVLQFNAILTDVDTNNVVWNWSASVSREQITTRSGIDFISQELITRLGGPRGPIHNEARDLLAQTDVTGQENFYVCAMLFSTYRTAPTAGATARLNACLDALGDSDSKSNIVLGGRAVLLAETLPDGDWAGEEHKKRIAEAEDLLQQALRAAPTSSFLWEQRARVHEIAGEHQEAESAYGTAQQQNAANIDAAAAHARHLALIGRMDLAVPMARRAIEAVPPLQVPDWFYCVPSAAALLNEDYARAQSLAERCGRVDTEWGALLILLAAQEQGDVEALGRALPRILEVATFRSSGILPRIRHRMTDPVLLAQVEDALRRAGVPEKSLTSPY